MGVGYGKFKILYKLKLHVHFRDIFFHDFEKCVILKELFQYNMVANNNFQICLYHTFLIYLSGIVHAGV